MVLRPVDVEQLLEPDHLARAIWEMTGRLDLHAYTTEVRAVEGGAGRAAIDPHLLIALWIYAYSEKVSSAREIERRCAYHPAYQWLTGCEVINHHTLSDFRVEHQQALDGLFAQLLAILSSEGLITLEQVVHDGTKVKAAASGQSFHREMILRRHLQAAQERVHAMGDPREEAIDRRTRAARQRAAREKAERLQQALEELKKVQAAPEARVQPGEQRASETDPEARPMRQGDGGSAPSHNVQISTDTAHSIIVGATVTQAGNDQQQLLPAVEEIERQNGRAPGQMIVDDGYTTRENIVAAEGQPAWELIGTGNVGAGSAEATARRLEKRGVAPDFHPQNFAFDGATNSYTCPAGKTLAYRYTKHDRVGVNRKAYRARATDCGACAFRQQCCPGASSRTLVYTENVPAVAAYIAKMQTEAARAAYRLRAPVAEFTNAWLKAKLGLRQFCVRGLAKVRCEVLWACLTYNIQQWFRLRWKVRPAAVA
ncbi:MAG: IS1182 family transposase [Acetobacteraceae bacterium]|nr:IS1182 family transposase [Acetobacteraceae bacterium]